ncbi:hypothetical protein [Streptomyces sp. NPDC047434]|uniref:hypothetical protein n=1 Tax=Streptomyces sp. NPDC047434 TaxID=3155143 RepID=UPI0033FC81D7
MRRVADSGDGSVPVVLVGDFNAPSHLDWPDVAWPDAAGSDWPSDHAAVITVFAVSRGD